MCGCCCSNIDYNYGSQFNGVNDEINILSFNELDKKQYFQLAKEAKMNHFLSVWYFNHRHIHIKDFLKNLKQCDKLKLFK